MRKVIICGGIRPDIIRLAPLFFEMKKHSDRFDTRFLYTGQHYDHNLSQIFFDDFNLPEPSFRIESGSGSPAFQISTVMRVCESVFGEQKPDLVLVSGDSNSALGVSLAAAKLNLKLAHLEAGLTSLDRSEPEEINRVLIDKMADLMLTSCDDANLNLIKQTVNVERVFLVGNTIIDSVKHFLPRAKQNDILDRMNLEGEKYILVTVHRDMNLKNESRLKKIIRIISAAAEHLPVVFPVHPHTSKCLENITESHSVLNNRNVRMCDALGYLEFLQVEQNALLALTDSRGVQDECSYLGIPCLTLTPSTVRDVTVSDGTNTVVDLDQAAVIRQIEYHLQGETAALKKPAFWDGQSAERAVRVIGEFFEKDEKPEAEKKAINSTGKVKMLSTR